MYQILLRRIGISSLLVSLAFSKAMDPEQYDIKNYPLMKTENLGLLYSLADQVSDMADGKFSAKKQVLVGMGQSPAYLLEMIRLIDQEKGRKDRSYLNVAFSGRYYEPGGCDLIDSYSHKQFVEFGSHYKQYLNKVGLSENDLNRDDTKFIILEVCHHCASLKSFLSFFKDYKKQPGVVYLQSSDFFARANLPVKNQRLALDAQEHKLTAALANADRFKDRLVPQFQVYRWKTVDPFKFEPEENAPIILKRLRHFVKDQFNY